MSVDLYETYKDLPSPLPEYEPLMSQVSEIYNRSYLGRLVVTRMTGSAPQLKIQATWDAAHDLGLYFRPNRPCQAISGDVIPGANGAGSMTFTAADDTGAPLAVDITAQGFSVRAPEGRRVVQLRIRATDADVGSPERVIFIGMLTYAGS